MENNDNPSLLNKFTDNMADFTKKHGMKICAGIFLVANAALFYKFLQHPEAVNPVRNVGAALLQECTNFYQLRGKKEKAYNFGTFGGACHVLSCVQDGLAFNAITWAMYTEAAYRGSAWPQRLDDFSSHMKNKMPVIDKLGDKIDTLKASAPVQKISVGFNNLKERILPKDNKLSGLIENKFDLLKDPHARAGTVAFVSTIGQWIEAGINHNTSLMGVMPAWLLATGFYMAHGLLHANDKKRARLAESPQP